MTVRKSPSAASLRKAAGQFRLGCGPLFLGLCLVGLLGTYPPEYGPSLPATGVPPPRPSEPRRPAVTNSPWHGAVPQVERYVKRTLHDAASFEAIAWGPVIPTKTGYRVRLTYRAKNLLGVTVTQTRTFYLNRAGEVYAVRE
ncbi:hypothetical protein [Candidatus Methylocalor cossyra]|uniref:PepSY domain-containing protein n=1 Tax=Candidatus Methylocalor cossyra TaxID=3108543 RepID=A0ABM9NFY9_9GAMM